MALSWLVELPLLLAFLWRRGVGRVCLFGLLATGLSHPVAWRAVSYLSPHEYTQGLWTIELSVVLVEAWVLRLGVTGSWRPALAVSAVANLGSFMAGWLLW
ncbi:hypothetical protein LMG26411_07456 [Cupriavidus numazuensis]|uniref:Uncharacterized protein n=2 Tax=Cupriavidus numazuensis TaxID=221992 RepID=A0ABM8TV25_9BURK|nr:hypothetical protein LMG26411_07456 [Cupriavidus numazuensis]